MEDELTLKHLEELTKLIFKSEENAPIRPVYSLKTGEELTKEEIAKIIKDTEGVG